MTTINLQTFSGYSMIIREYLQKLVEMESPTTEKSSVDLLSQWLASELASLGGDVTEFPQVNSGDHLRACWGSDPSGILVICHMDTVFDMGTLASNPFREVAGRFFGPGVLDMKAGIANFLGVMHLFQKSQIQPRLSLTALFTSDEETGSLTSRALIENEARKAKVVFCLEPALANGALKTARKGTGDIKLKVKGIASHAGVDHQSGRNAIEELAYHILEAQKLTDYSKGTTVNVGVVRGGTRSNVVPDVAEADVDFRVTSTEEFRRLEQWASARRPVTIGTSITAHITMDRPPMPRDDMMIATLLKAQSIAQSLDLTLIEGSTGGGSDANFIAPLGIPVLDGLGGVGEGAHSEREYVEVASLTERAALLSALILNW